LTWKGVGGSLGRAMNQVQRPAWDAQPDVAIADAITLLPTELLPPPPGPPRGFARVKRWLVGGAPPEMPPPHA
jgi:hypothetical protein